MQHGDGPLGAAGDWMGRLVGPLSALAVGAAAWRATGSPLAAGWTAVAVAAAAVLDWPAGRASGQRRRTPPAAAGAQGGLWGLLAGWLLWAGAPGELALTVMAVGTLLGAWLAAHGDGAPGAAWAAAAAALAPPAALALTAPAAHWPVLLLAALAPAWLALVLREVTRQRQVADELAAQRDALSQHLDARRQQIERLTVTAKTHQQKAAELAAELRRQSAELGLVKGHSASLARTLERVSPVDPVTELANERRFGEALAQEWARAKRLQLPVALILATVDEFAGLRSRQGAQMTQQCLQRIGAVLARHARRPGDCVARIGDGDFALLLPGADTDSAGHIGERLRRAVSELGLPHPDSPHGHVTVSVGSATAVPSRTESAEELVERARSALREAEVKGGNVAVRHRAVQLIPVVHWDPEDDGPLTVENLQLKLTLRGYRPHKPAAVGARFRVDQRLGTGYAIGVIKGRVRLAIEGATEVLRPGDCAFAPRGAVITVEGMNGDALCVEAVQDTAGEERRGDA